jgi:2-keto-3-deoxy-6-phosphogluconate aldolase
MSLTVEQVMELAPVIPVLVVDRVEDALPIAQALVKGGLPALEVTLRTPAALDVIREMAKVEGAVVGAGTVLNPAQLDAAMEAGARFIVSPGLTEPLGKAAIAANIPFLPGTATAGDIMRGMDMGLSHFKFFPAETSGGLPAASPPRARPNGWPSPSSNASAAAGSCPRGRSIPTRSRPWRAKLPPCPANLSRGTGQRAIAPRSVPP